ncbi:MAG TPA: polyamine ABC transporter substrate-binding protein [Steroidobacteraceae bacterium]|jgi:putrescine transport system substrate-binding protein|nr:polyamine ABC transporter substrate-binding protein [Steroidobacteraceae bacterium]
MRSRRLNAAWTLALLLAAGAGGTAGAAAEEKRLFIYNWSDFIGTDTIARFEKLTGIKVTYDVYDAEETMEARLMAGSSGYDVVSASTDFFSREIKAGVYETLDKARLPNWKNLDPRILAIQAEYDPGNQHAVPYLHSINGFAYNVDMIRARMPNAPVDSLDMIFKPQIVAKFADCGVTLIDSAEDTLQLALQYLGLDPNTTRREDFKAAEDLLVKVRPYIRSFDSTEYMNGLANKEVCIAMSWSSDYAQSRARAKAVGLNVNLAFTVPKEGANQTFSSLLIPRGAPHPLAAYAFINFILRPDVIAEITNQIFYGNDNIASRPLIDKRILDDVTLYPTPEIEARLYRSAEVSAATERIRTRTWTRVKTAE